MSQFTSKIFNIRPVDVFHYITHFSFSPIQDGQLILYLNYLRTIICIYVASIGVYVCTFLCIKNKSDSCLKILLKVLFFKHQIPSVHFFRSINIPTKLTFPFDSRFLVYLLFIVLFLDAIGSSYVKDL